MKLRFSIRDLLWFTILCAFSVGCRENKGKPAVDARSDMFLHVVQSVFHNDGWRTAGEIIIKNDGGFEWIDHDPFGANISLTTRDRGSIPPQLMDHLRNGISRKEKFETLDGVTTYEYGLDDSKPDHPPGIDELIALLSDREQQQIITADHRRLIGTWKFSESGSYLGLEISLGESDFEIGRSSNDTGQIDFQRTRSDSCRTLGLYRFVDDDLEICMSSPGDPRPTEFEYGNSEIAVRVAPKKSNENSRPSP